MFVFNETSKFSLLLTATMSVKLGYVVSMEAGSYRGR